MEKFFVLGTRGDTEQPMMRGRNLLLVENDMAVREALTRALAIENYQIFGAASSREAILIFQQNQIDIVLLDLNLEPDDGWEVFHKLKELRADLPIFVTSGQPERFVHSYANRTDGMLEKPFDMPALFGLLKRTTGTEQLCGIPSSRSMSRFALPAARRRPPFEMAIRTPAAAPPVKALIPPYWLFLYPWRALLYAFRALGKIARLPL